MSFIPYIPISKNPDQQIDLCVERGVAIVDLDLDVAKLQDDFTSFPAVEDDVPVEAVIQLVPELKRIQDSLLAKNMPRLVTGEVSACPIGHERPNHVDFKGVLSGISVIIPIFHAGDFSTHEQHESPVTSLTSNSLYFPGQAMLVRQNTLGKKPQPHSAVSVAIEEDRVLSGSRIFITVDAKNPVGVS